MYFTEQPNFLNGVVQFHTQLAPHELLQSLKKIERDQGRDFSAMRNGPRPIDLDILMYDELVVNDRTFDITIPHPRLSERDFVLRPLCDIDDSIIIPSKKGESSLKSGQLLQGLHKRHGNHGHRPLVPVTPLPSGRILHWGKRTLLMGVLNLTPDSFSDGGMFISVENALRQAENLIEHGFDIIDVS